MMYETTFILDTGRCFVFLFTYNYVYEEWFNFKSFLEIQFAVNNWRVE